MENCRFVPLPLSFSGSGTERRPRQYRAAGGECGRLRGHEAPRYAPSADAFPAGLASPRDLRTAKAWKPNPTRALLYSALLPGSGQIYNRKYWKLPIVWGAFTGCTYAILWNNKTYTEYRKAYADFMGGDPSQTAWHNFLPYGADPADYVNSEQLKARLKRGTEYYRRNRDLSIIITLGVYFLTMLDAYVDAELFDFNISPDLSFHFSPMVGTDDKSGFFRYGVSCGFTF